VALPRSAVRSSVPAAPALLSERDVRSLRRSLLAWYDAAGRSLAIREPGLDPWAVLVAEVMTQQTQVGRVEPSWRAFLVRFPDPSALAGASPADVIRSWRGLGYNRRALGLQRAAAAIEAGGGRVPDDPRALQQLPGVGPYTARAVAATAYGRSAAAVDVNVRRVLERLVGGDLGALGRAEAQAAADRLLDRRRPADWNHALMDLGASICRANSPACPECPLRRWCRAAAGGRPSGMAGAPERILRDVGARRQPRPGAAPVRFETTARWLRGRLVDRLRDEPPGSWVAIGGSLGEHPDAAVRVALRGLAADGLVELDATGRARLPLAPPRQPGGEW
jgi:A/G-specific adenine glycosylase